MKKFSPFTIGLLQSILVISYCIFAAFFMTYLVETTNFMTEIFYGVFVLVFFIISALITASAVFAYPIYLFINDTDSRKQSLQIVMATLLWLIILFIATLISGIIYYQNFYV